MINFLKYMFREVVYWMIGLFYKLNNKHLILEYRSKIALGSKFEGSNKLSHHSYFAGEMGYGSYIGDNSVVVGKVGRYCSIAAHVMFLSKTHPVKDYISTAPCFYSTKKQNGLTYVDSQKFNEVPSLENSKYSIVIGNDVYIGYGATIIAPTIIGDGVVIAANATVTGNVEPYSIVGGTPAKLIRKRFKEDDIEYLMRLQWWNKEEKWIKEYADKFDSIEKLKISLKENK